MTRACVFGPRFVGDPVDVVTGEVRDIARDFVIAGQRELHFDRWYASVRAYEEDRGLGFGHRHTFDWSLRLDVDGMTLDAPDDPVGFPHLWTDGVRVVAEGWVLERRSSTLFVLKRSSEPERHFERGSESDRELRLTKLVHAGGGETRLGYETGTVAGRPRASRLVSVEDTDGWALRFEWGTGHVRAVQGMGRPFGGGQVTLIRYEHDAAGDLIRGVDAYNHAFTWSYDPWHRVLRRADRNCYAFVYSYDELGRCTRAAGEDDVDAVRLEYDEAALETRVVHEANGATFLYRYLPSGSLSDITDPYGATRQFLYDDDGRLEAEVDASGGVWPVVRDAAGAVVGKRDPLGHFRSANEDPSDPDEDPLAEEVPPTTLEQEAGEALERPGFAVPRSGSLAMEVPSELRDALMPAESVGLEEEVRDPQGLLLRVERRFGDGSARSKRYGYDANGNLRHLRDADGSDWHTEHASWNQRVLERDPLGHTTRFSYSKRDRMVRVEDALGTETKYEWDLCDRLTAVHRHGKLRERYVLDAAGGLVEKRVPRVGADGVSGSAGSAADGGPASDEATLVTYERGPLGTMLARRTDAAVDGFGVDEVFARDPRGYLMGARSESGALTFEHDARGRRLFDAREDEGGRVAVRHVYVGSRLTSTSVQLEEDGPRYVVRYHYPDVPGDGARASTKTLLVVDPTDQVHRLRRVDAGVLQRDLASGTTEVTQYDDAGRCVAKASLGRAGMWRRRFSRSGEGDLLQRDDDRRGTTRYRYDAAHRLDGVQKPDGTIDVYAHDAAGNLLQKPGLSEGYVAGAQAGPAAVAFDTSRVALSRGNKLYRANGDRFHYDARDHIVAREGSWGRVTYVRDGLGRLRRIDWTPPAGAAGSAAASADGSRSATTWEAEYDALGRRTKKVVHRVAANGAPIRDEWRFVWDHDRLAAEVLPNGRARVYIYADAVALVPMLAVEYESATSDPREGRVYSFHTDHRGAVERVEDAAGNVVWEAEVGPYGEAHVLVGADFHQPFRLVGQYYDAETGLCAHRYRMYSPELGRFMESDPIGLQGGLNVYAWPGCPLVASDPLGLGCPHAESGANATPPAEGEGTPTSTPTRPPRRLEDMSDAELRDHCRTRARELQAAYEAAHERQSRAVTLSVGVVQDSRGQRRVVVTTSADGQRVPKAVRRAMAPDESVRATTPRLRRRREPNPRFKKGEAAHPTRNPRTRSETVEVLDNPSPPPATRTRPYERASRGEPVSGTRHHAEQRMETGAAANGETLLAQAPTRRCCSGCQTALGPDGLSRVPEDLRGN